MEKKDNNNNTGWEPEVPHSCMAFCKPCDFTDSILHGSHASQKGKHRPWRAELANPTYRMTTGISKGHLPFLSHFVMKRRMLAKCSGKDSAELTCYASSQGGHFPWMVHVPLLQAGWFLISVHACIDASLAKCQLYALVCHLHTMVGSSTARAVPVCLGTPMSLVYCRHSEIFAE